VNANERSAEGDLRRLVEAVIASPKYRYVHEDLVADVGTRELRRARNLREAIKATKNQLHQLSGRYLIGRADYVRWLDDLRRAAASGAPEALRAAARAVMARHASTRERLGILDQFYQTLLAASSPIHSVLDVACGLHPLAVPWMPLAPNACYYAYDVYTDLARFLDAWLRIVGLRGYSRAGDIVARTPTEEVDVAFLLKAIPCLDQIDDTAGRRLLDEIRAARLVVSFPVYSLGGREKGMLASYDARFRELVAGRSWSIRRFDFETELVYLVTK
jgi:16S rRNA (guanine(1405)-N(7))-methyltransferase